MTDIHISFLFIFFSQDKIQVQIQWNETIMPITSVYLFNKKVTLWAKQNSSLVCMYIILNVTLWNIQKRQFWILNRPNRFNIALTFISDVIFNCYYTIYAQYRKQNKVVQRLYLLNALWCFTGIFNKPNIANSFISLLFRLTASFG